MSYIYLASPYSHPDLRVRRDRYYATQDCVAWMLANRIWVYSPIVHCHFMAIEYELPKDAKYWRPYNRAMLRYAAALWTLRIPGWQNSEGIKDELESALELVVDNRGHITPGGYTYTHTPIPSEILYHAE